MVDDTLRRLKMLVGAYRNEDGTIATVPDSRYIGKVSDDVNKYSRELVSFLLGSSFFCKETKMYIMDINSSYNSIAIKLFTEVNKRVNVSTIQSKVWNDKVKLVSKFGADMILDITAYNNKDNLGHYYKVLKDLSIKYGITNILSKVALDFPDTSCVSSIDGVTDDDFKEFISIIAPYCSKQRNFISSNLPLEWVAYCKHLLGDFNLTSKEEMQRQQLVDLIL